VPEIADALQALARRADRSFVLDGVISGLGGEEPTLHAFDLLLDADDVLAGEPWTERRARLEALFSRRRVPGVVLVPVVKRGGAPLLERAEREGWAGIVAKRADSTYTPGEVSADWRRIDF
jgi:bifunctional non-homologous end joining protein LigD